MNKYVGYLLMLFSISLGSCHSKNYIFTGSYTKENKNGIHILHFNKKNGEILSVSPAAAIRDPSYLALSANKKILYAVNELPADSGGISALAVNKKTGALSMINQRFSPNNIAPCYLALDKSNRFVCTANYGSGTVAVYPLSEDGSLLPEAQNIQLPALNSRKPHAHQTIFSKNNKILYVNDLGNDKIYQYAFDASESKPIGKLIKTLTLPQGYGPRHSAIDKQENFLYLINEWKGILSVYDLRNDSQQPIQEIASIERPEEGKNNGSSAINISPDGRFLYTSNRGTTNNIVIFQIAKNGTLIRVGEQSTDLHPRDFIIDETGSFLLVAARDSNTVKTYRINKQTGMLTYTGYSATLPLPVALLQF